MGERDCFWCFACNSMETLRSFIGFYGALRRLESILTKLASCRSSCVKWRLKMKWRDFMKTLMKVVWYLEAALCGCVGWLLLVIGLQMVSLLVEANPRKDFYVLTGAVFVFVAAYAWKAQRRQRAEMLELLQIHFGSTMTQQYNWQHTALAVASAAVVCAGVILATILERDFGKVALDVGFGLPLILGVAGLLTKAVEAAFVKWMPLPKMPNLIPLKR